MLKRMSFGVQVAEDEVNELASYFVETNQWGRIAKGEIDIVRGEKGSGKSAIYSLLMTRQGDFFDQRILLVAAENPRGATVFRDLVADPPTTENEFIALWKIYALTIVAQQLLEYDIRGKNVEKVYRSLEDAGLLERDFSLAGLLRVAHDYVRRIVRAESVEGGLAIDPTTQMLTGITGKIVLREPSGDLRDRGYLTVDRLFAYLDDALIENDLKVWVLLDRLDVAFVENHSLEANALRALIRAYSDVKHRDQISLKIFLREDIWKRITEAGMREASHLIRYVILDWTQPALLNLIMRRLLNNGALLEEFGIDRAAILESADQQEVLLPAMCALTAGMRSEIPAGALSRREGRLIFVGEHDRQHARRLRRIGRVFRAELEVRIVVVDLPEDALPVVIDSLRAARGARSAFASSRRSAVRTDGDSWPK